MKIKLLLVFFFCSFSQLSSADYILKIGEDAYEMFLDEEVLIEVDGKYLPVSLFQKDILTYQTDNFSFEYPKDYSPSKTDLGDGVYQSALITPLGSLVLIQEHLTSDPSGLIDLMIHELTKEEQEYGYRITSADTSITLSDGTYLEGKIVTSKYKGSDIDRIIYTYGVKDSGLLIVTQVDHESEPTGEELISGIIDSLKISMR
ncbi:MAG: hypothetical protein KTR18_12920 [Acidiferrobacterales bacterium]|nr:hypothetical protein [Acidiferrobacterales bacterium]